MWGDYPFLEDWRVTVFLSYFDFDNYCIYSINTDKNIFIWEPAVARWLKKEWKKKKKN